MATTTLTRFKDKISFELLSKGPVMMDLPRDKPAVERVTFKRTGILGGYIGYNMPTEFVKFTARFKKDHWKPVISRATDEKWTKAVEEAITLYELLDTREPSECDLEALRAEWQAYKEAADPYTDAVVDHAGCTTEEIVFVRYILVYVDRPLEMNTELHEALGLFAELEREAERKRMYGFIEFVYSTL